MLFRAIDSPSRATRWRVVATCILSVALQWGGSLGSNLAFGAQYKTPSKRPPVLEQRSLNRRLATSRLIYRELRNLHIDLINAVAFRGLSDAQRAELVQGAASKLLEIRSLDRVKQDLKQFSEQILLPAATRWRGDKGLRGQALAKVTRGIELIEENRATAACATLWAAANRVGKEYARVQQEKWDRYRQQKAHKGRVARDHRTGRYAVYMGRYHHEEIGSWNIPIPGKVRPTFGTRWEAFRFIDAQLDSEYGYRVETPRDIGVLDAVATALESRRDARRSRRTGSAGSDLDLTKVTQKLFALVPRLATKSVVERQLARKAVLSAAVLTQHQHYGHGYSQVTQASGWLRTRLSNVQQMVEALERVRGYMRTFTDEEARFLDEQMVWANKTFPRTAGHTGYSSKMANVLLNGLEAMLDRVRGSKEPDHALIEPGISRALDLFRRWFAISNKTGRLREQGDGRGWLQARKDRAQLFTAAREAFRDVSNRINFAGKLNAFMKRYRDRFAEIRSAGVEQREAEARAFHRTFDEFITRHRSMKRNLQNGVLSHAYHLWWLKFHQAAFVSPKVDNPARRDPSIPSEMRKRLPKRVANPVFRAFNLYFELIRLNSIEAILADKLIQRRITPGTQMHRLLNDKLIAGKHRLFPVRPGDRYALNETERKQLEESLAALPAYQIDPRALNSPRTLQRRCTSGLSRQP